MVADARLARRSVRLQSDSSKGQLCKVPLASHRCKHALANRCRLPRMATFAGHPGLTRATAAPVDLSTAGHIHTILTSAHVEHRSIPQGQLAGSRHCAFSRLRKRRCQHLRSCSCRGLQLFRAIYGTCTRCRVRAVPLMQPALVHKRPAAMMRSFVPPPRT